MFRPCWLSLANDRPDVVVIALHGKGGEDGTLQGLLDVLGIRYTGSGVLASALAMDKAMCKRVLMGGRRPDAAGSDAAARRSVQSCGDLHGLPLIVKPNAQGSTIGMTVVRQHRGTGRGDCRRRLSTTTRFWWSSSSREPRSPCRFWATTTLEVLPIVEIVPAGGFYDYKAKYTAGATDEIVPARISERCRRRSAAHRAVFATGLWAAGGCPART